MEIRPFGLNKSFDSETEASRLRRTAWYCGISGSGAGIGFGAWLFGRIIQSGEAAQINIDLVENTGLAIGGLLTSAAVLEWGVDRAITSYKDKRGQHIEGAVCNMDRGELVDALGAQDVRVALAAGNRLETIISYQVLPEGSE